MYRKLCHLNVPRCYKDQYTGSAECDRHQKAVSRFEKLQSGSCCAWFCVHVYLPACLSVCLYACLSVSLPNLFECLLCYTSMLS